ncbi:PAAR domain-containing protein [Acetobacteraceae bacterium KSS8]|uniref:PAAR domain-containing protein n=1 Tax=Endosaccharibacter trunci TaxID=2812733 RepID=A0ABT1W9C8_9PROT|nr:PAAR domain-containing protein [Acetobacteraceae bacterium KSS8]
MPDAARVDDLIAHTEAQAGFLAGALIGVAAAAAVAVAIGAVATAAAAEIATAGLATPLIAGAAVTGGEFIANMIIGGSLMSMGEELGEKLGTATMGPPTGMIIEGALNVLINGRPAARVLDPVVCTMHGDPDAIAQGAKRVLINGRPAARVGDKIVCGGVILTGSANVVIGSPPVSMAPIRSEISPWARRAVLIMSIAPGAIGLGRALGPALRGIAEDGFVATAKSGANAIGRALEDRAGGVPAPSEGEAAATPRMVGEWEKPYADQKGVTFDGFDTKRTYDPLNPSPTEATANRVLKNQGWNEKMRNQIIDSGGDHKLVSYSAGSKVYGFSSKNYMIDGQTVIKGSDPNKPSAYWFHEDDLADMRQQYWNETSGKWDSPSIKRDFALPCFNAADDLHAATVNRDLDNIVSARIDPATENYNMTLEDGTIRSGKITLPGGQRQITLPADSLGQFEILR